MLKLLRIGLVDFVHNLCSPFEIVIPKFFTTPLKWRKFMHAVDASSQGIQKLEKYARSEGLDTIEGEVADVRTVQLATNFYDAIVAVTILDHMTEEEGKTVAQAIIDSLKPDGFVFIEAFTVRDPAANKIGR